MATLKKINPSQAKLLESMGLLYLMQDTRTAINLTDSEKMEKLTSGFASGNVVSLNDDGEAIDSGVAISDIYTKTEVDDLLDTKIGSLVEDTTPQLGGNLDLNTFVITGMEIGSDIQAYDADTAKTDTAQDWTAVQTIKSGLTIDVLGTFTPKRIRQANQPTPSAGEIVVWSDSDDDAVRLVYNDANAGVVTILLS